MEKLVSRKPVALALLRIVSGLIVLQHGLQKLILWPPSVHHPGPVPLFSLFGAAGVLETAGGILLVLGLFTRVTAFLLCGEMAVAYWGFHFVYGLQIPNGWMPVVNEGDLAVVLCFVFLLLSLSEPERPGLDAMLLAPRHKAT